MKDLFEKFNKAFKKMTIELGKRLAKLNPESVISVLIGGLFGIVLLFITILNIIHCPFIITWMAFIIPILIMFALSVNFMIKVDEESAGKFVAATGFAVVSTIIGAAVYASFGVVFVYTIPILIYAGSVYAFCSSNNLFSNECMQ